MCYPCLNAGSVQHARCSVLVPGNSGHTCTDGVGGWEGDESNQEGANQEIG